MFENAERKRQGAQSEAGRRKRCQGGNMERVSQSLWEHPCAGVLRLHGGKHRLSELHGKNWSSWTSPLFSQGKRDIIHILLNI